MINRNQIQQLASKPVHLHKRNTFYYPKSWHPGYYHGGNPFDDLRIGSNHRRGQSNSKRRGMGWKRASDYDSSNSIKRLNKARKHKIKRAKQARKINRRK